MRETETYTEPDPEQIQTAEELQNFLVWRAEQEAIEQGNKLFDKDVCRKSVRYIKPDDQSAHFCLKDQSGNFIGGGRITKMPFKSFKEPVAMIAGAYIRPNDRNKGLVKKITAEREKWARNEGLTDAVTLIINENIPSIVSKLNQGYYLIDLSSPNGKTGSITLRKKLTADKPKTFSETQIVPYDDLFNIKELLEAGWVGTNLTKNEDQYYLKLGR